MEYLLELRETHRYANKRVAQNKVIVVGDIGLVYEVIAEIIHIWLITTRPNIYLS